MASRHGHALPPAGVVHGQAAPRGPTCGRGGARLPWTLLQGGIPPNYLLYLEEDGTEAVANARRFGVGLGAVCADVVESLNGIIKRAYNDHSGRGWGGMPQATQLEW